MIRDDLPPAMRWKVLGIALAFAAAGGVALWLGLTGVMPSVRALVRRAPLVAFRPSDLIPLPIALSMFAFAAMCLLPVPRDDPSGPRRRTAASATWRAATVLLAVAAVGLVLAGAAADCRQGGSARALRGPGRAGAHDTMTSDVAAGRAQGDSASSTQSRPLALAA